MKVFLSADMEGTCGVVSWPETQIYIKITSGLYHFFYISRHHEMCKFLCFRSFIL